MFGNFLALFSLSNNHLQWLRIYVWLRGTCFTLAFTPGPLVVDVACCNQITEPLIWSRPPDELNLDLQQQRCNMKGHKVGWWWCVWRGLRCTHTGAHTQLHVSIIGKVSINLIKNLFTSANIKYQLNYCMNT